ncbi:unnamed protein product, partial [Prorocentrum cordatum]
VSLASLGDPSLHEVQERKQHPDLVAERRVGEFLYPQLQQLQGKMSAVEKSLARQRDEVVPDLARRLEQARQQQESWAQELGAPQQEKAALAKRLGEQQQPRPAGTFETAGGPHCGPTVVAQLVNGLEKLVGTEGDGDATMEGGSAEQLPAPIAAAPKGLLKLVRGAATGDAPANEEAVPAPRDSEDAKRKRDELIEQFVADLPGEERSANRIAMGSFYGKHSWVALPRLAACPSSRRRRRPSPRSD